MGSTPSEDPSLVLHGVLVPSHPGPESSLLQEPVGGGGQVPNGVDRTAKTPELGDLGSWLSTLSL